MSTPVTLRIRQQGFIRSQGYQTTQWAVTVPISDPLSDPPIATDPLTYAPLFIIRNSNGIETLERVSTLLDYEKIPNKELEFFDIKGTYTNNPFELAIPGDLIKITSNLSYWIQPEAPYSTMEFEILQQLNRAQGTGANCFSGSNQLQLNGYSFTNSDIGRLVKLAGFAVPGNNGYARIMNVVGNTATTNKTFIANDTGASWAFPWFKIRSSFSGLEPRFFPTKEVDLKWELKRSSLILCSGSGGETDRNNSEVLSRSVRCTELLPTLDSSEKLFSYVRGQVNTLQRNAAINNSAFTVLITYTVGP